MNTIMVKDIKRWGGNLKRQLINILFYQNKAIPKRGPDFIVVGMSRSGTTYLHNVLNEHPDIFLPKTKELNYFNYEGRYSESLKGYLPLFLGYSGEKAIGEITPSYIELENQYNADGSLIFYRRNRSDQTPIERIHKQLPNCKIIVSLRDPMTRAKSFYSKSWLQGRVDHSLQEEILEELTKGTSKLNTIHSNRYDLYFKNLFKFYPKESVHVMIFEEWINNQTPYLNKLASFIDVPHQKEWPTLESNKQNKATRYGGDVGRKGKKPPVDLDAKTEAAFKKELIGTKEYVETLIGRTVPWNI